MVNAQWGSMRPNPHNQKLSANTPNHGLHRRLPRRRHDVGRRQRQGPLQSHAGVTPQGVPLVPDAPGDFGLRRRGPQVPSDEAASDRRRHKTCINAQKIWVLPDDGDESDDEECAFVSKKRRRAA